MKQAGKHSRNRIVTPVTDLLQRNNFVTPCQPQQGGKPRRTRVICAYVAHTGAHASDV